MAVVLIVEDTDSAAALEIALSELNDLEVKILSNGQDALTLLRTSLDNFAALITDLHLPLVDGFELVTAVRADHRYSRLPIVVITGDNHPQNFNRLRALGANACFSKPYSPSEVRRTLEDLLHVS